MSGRGVEGLADSVCAGVAGDCEVRVGGRLRGVPYEQAGCRSECRAGDQRQHRWDCRCPVSTAASELGGRRDQSKVIGISRY